MMVRSTWAGREGTRGIYASLMPGYLYPLDRPDFRRDMDVQP